jgi:hypothetical protein
LIPAILLLISETGVAMTRESDSVTGTNWSLLMEARSGTLHDSLATLGVRSDATSEYDAAYDTPRPPNPPGNYIEIYFPHSGSNWPAFLGTKFSSDFTTPASPEWIFAIESTVQPGSVTLEWDTTEIQSLPAGYNIYLKDSATGQITDVRALPGYTFAYTGPRLFRAWVENNLTFVSVNAKWNLVSLPLVVADGSVKALFPNSVSDAFRFESMYITAETLEAGNGYWLKFASPEVVSFTGSALSSAEIPVHTGWNIIGSLDHDVPAPTGGIIVSSFFGYDNGYHIADTLKTGKAYWVKVNAEGIITLGP